MKRIPIDPDAKLVPVEGLEGVAYRHSKLTIMKGLVSTDDGLAWFEPGDPWANRLELYLAPMGDDFNGIVFYGGLPVLIISTGPWGDDINYSGVVPEYEDETMQEVHALFFEMMGELPGYDSDESHYLSNSGYEHPASVLVHEGHNLYTLGNQMKENAGDQGYNWVELIDLFACAMKAADPNLPDTP